MTRSPIMRIFVLVLAVLVLGVPAWTAPAAKPAAKKAAPKKAAGGLEGAFYRDLKKKDVATVEDAIGAVSRFKGYKGNDDMQAELDFLTSQNVRFRKEITSAVARTPVTKGNAAHIFLTALNIKSSVMRYMLPSSQRIAVRTAIAKKLLPKDSIATEKMSGGDLMAVLTKCVDFKNKKGGAGEGGGGGGE